MDIKMNSHKNTPVYIYCRSGRRSAIAVKAMKKLGYII